MYRLTQRTTGSDVLALASWVLSIPRISKLDAIVVLQGLGEYERVLHAISIWNCHPEISWLLIAGQNSNEHSFRRLTAETLQSTPFNLLRTQGVVIQNEADNTKHQALWIDEQVTKLGIRSLMLCAPPYHIVRAYLTILKSLRRRVILIPEPTPMPPSYLVPEIMIEADNLVAGEYERIEKYQASAEIAKLSEVKEYLEWLWQQVELKKYLPASDRERST